MGYLTTVTPWKPPVPLWLLTIIACGLGGPTSPVLTTPSQTGPATPPIAREVSSAALARSPGNILTLSIPLSNRPKKAMAPKRFGLISPLIYKGTSQDTDVYSSALPIHSNLMPTKLEGTHSFGSAAPPGLRVRLESRYLNFERKGLAPFAYGFSRDELFIGIPTGDPAPDWQKVSLEFEKATTQENSLNQGTGDTDARSFVTRSLTLDATSYTGLYLPAPANATWSIALPKRAVLGFRGTIIPPAIRTTDHTDGASVLLSIHQGSTELATKIVDLELEQWQDVRWDLSAHAGQTVTLEIATEPGLSPLYDYVFLEEPVVYAASETPRRTVLVFIDTLRPDHLGTYGYARATSPAITAWSEHAAVFENARTVAPWTLPSARTALSGQQPEDWYDHPNLPERFSQAGFFSHAIVANAFLSQPFDMQRGFSQFQFEHLMTAEQVSKAAVQVFTDHADQDVFLLVHYMDPHLPYFEPFPYNYRWARTQPSVRMARNALSEVHRDDDNFQAVHDYTIARYDQNIRYVDDQLVAVLDAAGLDATVVLFSDHGEEFWDHDSFEHGHSFYDELLHIPMIVRSPHVPPGRYDAPVSLLDIAPTTLALEGLDPTDGPGISLVDLLHKVPGAADELANRPQAFGRPLYNNDGWAVLDDGVKWINRDGKQAVYAMATDPGEQSDISTSADVSGYPAALQEALSRDVPLVWRVKPKTRLGLSGTRIELSHPLGFQQVWTAYDPRGRAAATKVFLHQDGRLIIEQPRNSEMPSSVYVVPNGDPMAPDGLAITVIGAGQSTLKGVTEGVAINDGAERQVLLEVGDKGWSVIVDTAFVPVPSGVSVSAYHEDVEQQLIDLGYAEPE